ncbi:hypothetical protein [Streptomyces sp. 11x1]|uniref:hypothetical protein n=1 Tax=Streptomyces sp. 11x1 TaxID=3038642 RepID=UPI00293070E1|nr:hypothetical protein [Streptomyces sp. 11x1]WNZ14900.1 hypothetical protein P8T65_46540 [Streptomyces sp. 11x1]
MTTAVSLPLWDVIVTGKPLGPLPNGVDPGRVRVAPAADVRAGDLVVGYVDGHPGGRWMPKGYVGEVCYRALPATHPQGWEVLSLDGELFQWSPHDLVLIVPAGLAPETYRPGDRVERIAERILDGSAAPRRYAHHGAVIDADDGTVTVRFDAEWLPTTLPATHVRHVEAEFVEDDRKAYGFAHGDTVTLPWRPAVRGTVVDLWRDLGNVLTAYVVWETEPPSDVRVRDLRPVAPLPAAA